MQRNLDWRIREARTLFKAQRQTCAQAEASGSQMSPPPLANTVEIYVKEARVDRGQIIGVGRIAPAIRESQMTPYPTQSFCNRRHPR